MNLNSIYPVILAGGNAFDEMSRPIIELINSALNPALAIVGALGAIYCILLGVKLAKAEEPQDQMKAKQALKNAIIGFVMIFVLMVLLKIGLNVLKTWMENSTKGYKTML